ncbi:CDP-archaeol synthase [Amycolatopsis nalaikhensis]|uniref:CDP-archaeol synthase n=1 Tax=Amycolatopsis nalaikhensis TaxID=715472 RepID=A0ABY8XF75_9PSEU|nr:CDP-archaeol synthase [Amycolatopsis sp. 2-2]WIV54256.1 CDP-archaeol synthase [Amycolatopsis sp. 2-2]
MISIARLWRTVLPRRGSVARPSDRVQAGLLVFLVLLALAALPFAAAVGSETHARQQVQSARELSERTRVTATLLADGPPITANTRSGVVGTGAPTDATWTLADGTRRVGEVVADRGTLAGETLTVWVDRTGTPVDPPLSGAGVVIDAVGAGLGLWLGTLAVLAACYRLTVFFLDRARYARWQQEWLQEQNRETHS